MARILVVEDDPVAAATLSALALRQYAGCMVDSAATPDVGEEAVVDACQEGTPYDLVIVHGDAQIEEGGVDSVTAVLQFLRAVMLHSTVSPKVVVLVDSVIDELCVDQYRTAYPGCCYVLDRALVLNGTCGLPAE